MKRKLVFFIFGVFLISMFSGAVSAANVGEQIAEVMDEGIDTFFEIINPVLERIIGPTSSSEIFLTKSLIWVIIFGLVWIAINQIELFKTQKWVHWLLAIVVSVLSIRWIGSDDIVRSIILPYSALAVFLSAGLPFVFAFAIIERSLTKTARKVAWIMFAAMFIALWVVRSTGAEPLKFAWIYLAVAILSVIVMLLDGTIQRFYGNIKVDRLKQSGINMQIRAWKKKMDEANDEWINNPGSSYTSVLDSSKTGELAYHADLKRIERALKKLYS